MADKGMQVSGVDISPTALELGRTTPSELSSHGTSVTDASTSDLTRSACPAFYLTNIGLSHFFTKEELRELLPGWSVADPCLSQYELPVAEAQKRGYDRYLQSMLIVYAIK
jgi:hypothetical protein